MITSYYLSLGNNYTDIRRQYVNAVETRNRIASPLLSDILGHLEKLVTAYQRLKAVLAVDLIEHTTSVPGQIHASINTIVQQTQNSLAEFSSKIVDEFADYYEQNTDFLVMQVIDPAKAILSYHTYFANMDADDADSFNISRIRKIFDYGDAYCKALNVIIDHFEVNRRANFSTKLYLDRTCRPTIYDYCYTGSPFTTLTTNYTDHIEELARSYQSMADSARFALKCGPMYRTFLNEVQSWLKLALTLNSSLPLQPADRRYILMELEQELSWLKSISRTFAKELVV